MKRMNLFLILMTIFACWTIPAYAKVDLTHVRENNDIFYIDVGDSGNAFIGTNMSFNDTIFSHKYSLSDYPSYTEGDIIIIDYFEDDPVPAWRLWFNYSARNYIGITSITITMDDVEYTFTGVGGKEKMSSHDSYVTETPNIVFGTENFGFWGTFIRKVMAMEDITEVMNMSLPVVLHGTEDIETEINGNTLTEMYILAQELFEISDTKTIQKINGTTMKTVNLKPTNSEQ